MELGRGKEGTEEVGDARGGGGGAEKGREGEGKEA